VDSGSFGGSSSEGSDGRDWGCCVGGCCGCSSSFVWCCGCCGCGCGCGSDEVGVSCVGCNSEEAPRALGKSIGAGSGGTSRVCEAPAAWAGSMTQRNVNTRHVITNIQHSLACPPRPLTPRYMFPEEASLPVAQQQLPSRAFAFSFLALRMIFFFSRALQAMDSVRAYESESLFSNNSSREGLLLFLLFCKLLFSISL